MKIKRFLFFATSVLCGFSLLAACSGGGGGGGGSAEPTIKLPSTGQTLCFDASGNPVDCAAPAGHGQDGALQTGVAWPNPRFADNGDGTVTDNLTGLIWLQDAQCANTISYDPDSTGNGLVSWQHALDFVAGINAGTYANCGAGSTDWRLPNRNEIRSLIDFSQSAPALPPGHPFANVQTFYYWSSTTYAAGTTNADCLLMTSGFLSNHPKTQLYNVWPVRGGK